jgi:hypothetical protein
VTVFLASSIRPPRQSRDRRIIAVLFHFVATLGTLAFTRPAPSPSSASRASRARICTRNHGLYPQDVGKQRALAAEAGGCVRGQPKFVYEPDYQMGLNESQTFTRDIAILRLSDRLRFPIGMDAILLTQNRKLFAEICLIENTNQAKSQVDYASSRTRR